MMDHEALIEGIKGNAWALYDYGAGVPTMLSATELQMLAWLGEKFDFGQDDFVADLGSFLGGSTHAMASGIVKRRGIKPRIHAYDLFKVPDDQYSQALIGMDRSVGSSVLDLFEHNTKRFAVSIDHHASDLRASHVPRSPLGVAFVDVAKSPELNDFILRRFFPLLTPGKSIVIQQDHNDHSCPWIAISMELFRDRLEYLADDSSSRIFLSTKAISAEDCTAIEFFTHVEQTELLDAASARSKNPVSRYLVLASKVWLVYERSGPEGAFAFLDEIKSDQPWPGDPYVNHVASAVRHVAKAGGRNAFLHDYFGPPVSAAAGD